MKKVGKLMEGGEMLAAYRARSDSDERKRDRKTKRIILSEYNRQMFAKGIFAKSFRQAAKRTATARRAFVAVALASAASLSQSKGETSHAAALEFPVVLQQNVVAGKTAVGAKVQAKLTIATLLHGVVIPQDAVISGEVSRAQRAPAGDQAVFDGLVLPPWRRRTTIPLRATQIRRFTSIPEIRPGLYLCLPLRFRAFRSIAR